MDYVIDLSKTDDELVAEIVEQLGVDEDFARDAVGIARAQQPPDRVELPAG